MKEKQIAALKKMSPSLMDTMSQIKLEKHHITCITTVTTVLCDFCHKMKVKLHPTYLGFLQTEVLVDEVRVKILIYPETDTQ